jgi:hypothetical protein
VVQQKAPRAGLTLSLHGVVFDILVLALPKRRLASSSIRKSDEDRERRKTPGIGKLY